MIPWHLSPRLKVSTEGKSAPLHFILVWTPNREGKVRFSFQRVILKMLLLKIEPMMNTNFYFDWQWPEEKSSALFITLLLTLLRTPKRGENLFLTEVKFSFCSSVILNKGTLEFRNSCFLGKSHILYAPLSLNVYNAPFDLVYSDMWDIIHSHLIMILTTT